MKNKPPCKNKSKTKTAALAPAEWVFHLYIAGDTPHCMLTLDNLDRFCSQFIPNQYEIIVIDLLIHPERAEADNIIAIPTTVKIKPEPTRFIIGDFSDHGLMLMKLGLGHKNSSVTQQDQPK